jgi:hypothetical protein
MYEYIKKFSAIHFSFYLFKLQFNSVKANGKVSMGKEYKQNTHKENTEKRR